jgi:hypothetical protein
VPTANQARAQRAFSQAKKMPQWGRHHKPIEGGLGNLDAIALLPCVQSALRGVLEGRRHRHRFPALVLLEF